MGMILIHPTSSHRRLREIEGSIVGFEMGGDRGLVFLFVCPSCEHENGVSIMDLGPRRDLPCDCGGRFALAPPLAGELHSLLLEMIGPARVHA